MPRTDEELRETAKKHVQARNGFIVHLLMYLFGNGMLVAIWAFSGRGYPWFIWPVFGWGIGIVAHATTLAIGPGSGAEERAIEREVQRLRLASRPANG